jgi:glutathione S-transferase
LFLRDKALNLLFFRYKDVNPELKVPALNVEGQNIAESLVITEYIADRFPEANLLPKEPLKRANIRFAIEYFSTKVNAVFYKYVFNSKAEGAREAFEKDVNAGLVRVSVKSVFLKGGR